MGLEAEADVCAVAQATSLTGPVPVGYKSHLYIISLHHLGFLEVDLGLEADLRFSEEDFGIGSRFGTFGRGFWDFGSRFGSIVGICGSTVGELYCFGDHHLHHLLSS